MFQFIDYSGYNGRAVVSLKNAADIMAVSLTTAKKYAQNPEKADKCRMAYLEAVTCRRVLPKNWPVWVDGDMLYTDSGYSFNKSELNSTGWLRETFHQTQKDTTQMRLRIAELEQQVNAKKANKWPDNVIEFKTR